jgi:4-hydroxy-3-methylbut-2-enyl diphosphate reductase
VRIILTSGASCPDSVIEGVIHKINSFYSDIKPVEEAIKQLSN